MNGGNHPSKSRCVPETEAVKCALTNGGEQMNWTVDTGLSDFHQFFGTKVGSGIAEISPEEALDEWRDLHPSEKEGEDFLAIRETLEDVAKGDRGISLEEFDRKFRKRHGIPG